MKLGDFLRVKDNYLNANGEVKGGVVVLVGTERLYAIGAGVVPKSSQIRINEDRLNPQWLPFNNETEVWVEEIIIDPEPVNELKNIAKKTDKFLDEIVNNKKATK